MKYIIAIAAFIFAGSVQGQSWTQFLGSTPTFPTELAPGHGLAIDGAGRTFVKTLNTLTKSGPESSHLYSLNQKGSHAWMWSLVSQPLGIGRTLASNGFSAQSGYRVAWFEMGKQGVIDDVLFLYDPYDPYGHELRFQRDGNTRILFAATDGTGGAVIVRKPYIGQHLMEHIDASGNVLWSTALGGNCLAGTMSMDIDDANIEFNRAPPLGPRTHVVGRCNGGIVGQSRHFVQAVELASGQVSAQQLYRPNLFGGQFVARHTIGQGSWLYEMIDGSTRTLAVADVDRGFYPVSWPPNSGPVRVDRLDNGALIGAKSPTTNIAYSVGRIARSGGGLLQVVDVRHYPALGLVTDRPLYFSEDSNGHRIVVFRDNPLPVPTTLSILKFDSSGQAEWFRNIEGVTGPTLPQLRIDPYSNEFVLAVDRLQDDGTLGVHVERFGAYPPYWCPPGNICLDPPNPPPETK